MNSSTNLKTRSNYYLAFTVLLSLAVFSAWKGAYATQSPSSSSAQADQVLAHTQSAMINLRIDPSASLEYVKKSLALIDEIEGLYSKNTTTELAQDNDTTIATGYLHHLPKVDLAKLKQKSELSSLIKKMNADIFYKQSDEKSEQSKQAWFDYTFAKASLITAREALKVNHSLEAVSNLERVFEAVYINPDFNVTEDLQIN